MSSLQRQLSSSNPEVYADLHDVIAKVKLLQSDWIWLQRGRSIATPELIKDVVGV